MSKKAKSPKPKNPKFKLLSCHFGGMFGGIRKDTTIRHPHFAILAE